MEKKKVVQIVKKVVNRKSPIPILTSVCLTGKTAIVTDLETTVVVPFNSSITGCIGHEEFIQSLEIFTQPEYSIETEINEKGFPVKYVVIQNEKESGSKIRTELLDSESFVSMADELKYVEIGRFDNSIMDKMEEGVHYLTKDDLIPAMTGLYFGKEIVGRDASFLYRSKISEMSKSFILPKSTIDILIRIGGEWDLVGDDRIGKFTNENGIVVHSRFIDAKYPNYETLFPTSIGVLKASFGYNELIREVRMALKFTDKKVARLSFDFNETGVELHSENIDGGAKYTKMLEQVDVVQKQYLKIFVDGNKLLKILTLKDSSNPVCIKLWGATKALVINEETLLMPLMDINS